jgi:hypothetical protein
MDDLSDLRNVSRAADKNNIIDALFFNVRILKDLFELPVLLFEIFIIYRFECGAQNN